MLPFEDLPIGRLFSCIGPLARSRMIYEKISKRGCRILGEVNKGVFSRRDQGWDYSLAGRTPVNNIVIL